MGTSIQSSTLSVPTHDATLAIDAVSDGFQVSRADTKVQPTEMVNLCSCGDGPRVVLVGPTVDQHLPAYIWTKIEQPVVVGRLGQHRPFPEPVVIGALDIKLESLLYSEPKGYSTAERVTVSLPAAVVGTTPPAFLDQDSLVTTDNGAEGGGGLDG